MKSTSPPKPIEADPGDAAIGRDRWAFLLILLGAAFLRLTHLGRLSLWYDEVVTMRLARQPDPVQLFRLLGEIDASRAPLHPLMLQAWLRILGASDWSGRSLSAFLGVLTVAAIYRLGREIGSRPVALWASGLAAISPALVRYSQEVRMYSWLVLLTCSCWLLLLSMRRSAAIGKQAAYGLGLAALVYSHPLGLLMVAALGLAYWLGRAAYRLSIRGWLLIHLGFALAFLPWASRYFDHEPEFTVGRLPIRFLLGLPIEFIGGNRWALLAAVAIIAFGLGPRQGGLRDDARLVRTASAGRIALLCWFLLPPLCLYGYSHLAKPVFGPSRYMLYVAPAYLLLVATGLARLPRIVGWPVGLIGVVLAGVMLRTMVYAPDLKADWRSAAEYLRAQHFRGVVWVAATDPARNLEVETARYYLDPEVEARPVPSGTDSSEQIKPVQSSEIFAVGLRDGKSVAPLPPGWSSRFAKAGTIDFDGLRLLWKPEPQGFGFGSGRGS